MDCNFKDLVIKGKKLKPVVQGGMGVGISASGLSSAVARENCVGTIASVDLRHLHPDLVEQSAIEPSEEKTARLNRVALDREIKAAKKLSGGAGMIAVNVMKALKDFAGLTRQSCESGADAIVMGAGLPLELPQLTKDFPDVGLIPILSESRGVALVLRRWMRQNRLPDAIVIEHPAHAGGHLGSPKMEEIGDDRFNFSRVIAEVKETFKNLGIESEKIPLIVAGGMASFGKVKEALLNWGADAVQIGTAFAVTKEGDAHPNFKRVLASARPEEIVDFMSVAGLPARGVATPFLRNYIKREKLLQSKAKCDPARCVQGVNCLSVCGLRDGIEKIGQFCIDLKLAAAFRGEVDKGLFFRGKDPLPFGDKIRSVKDTVRYLLSGEMPNLASLDVEIAPMPAKEPAAASV